jgi:Trk K+ transport system NAD-binding subunit
VIQGLRPIRDVGHIVVFGAGQVGTRVVDYLCDIHAVVTVVERNPTPELLRRARSREINLLTGDGTLDATLDLCNLGQARSAIVVTDSDSTNLEIGFGARARRSTIPVIMRIAEPGFAAAIRKHFEIRRAFSAAALAASAISDLVVTPSARGRVSFAGRSFRIAEYPAGSDLARDGTPLAAARTAGSVRAVRAWSDVGADDAVLVLLEADESRLKA